MEAEFVACYAAVQEVMCLMRFVEHLRIIDSPMGVVKLFCDIQIVVDYTKKT